MIAVAILLLLCLSSETAELRNIMRPFSSRTFGKTLHCLHLVAEFSSPSASASVLQHGQGHGLITTIRRGTALFESIYTTTICGATVVIVDCPLGDSKHLDDAELLAGCRRGVLSEEIQLGREKYGSRNRFHTFLGGRVALRRACDQQQTSFLLASPIFSNELGAPALPQAIRGE